MLTIVTAALLAFASATPPRCTMISKMGIHRPDDAPVLIMRPTRDSVSDGRYMEARDGVVRATPSAARSTEVFGQIMNLVDVEGPDAALVRRSRKVVILWWSITPSCSLWYASPMREVLDEEMFVLSRTRPQSEWINGLPTFDVYYNDWVYSQRRENYRVPDSAMTVTEYRKFFNALSVERSSWKDQLSDLEKLRDWAESNPQLAKKQPARSFICVARTVVDQSVECPN